MNRNQKIILIIIIVIVGILFLLFFVGGRKKTVKVPASTAAPTVSLPSNFVPKSKPLNEVEIKEMKVETQILAVARTFAERYGSFSNQGGFNNLLDLEPIVTTSLWNDLQAFHGAQQNEIGKEYYGVSTRTLNTKLGKFDSDSYAEVSVQTQRDEARGTTANPRVYYQELKLQLVKLNNNWLVDTAKWQ